MAQVRRGENLRKEAVRIAEVLAKNYQPEKIILFGSAVSGRVGEWSDLDMVIIKKTNKRFCDRIAEVLSLSEPKEAVDFLVYTPEEFEDMAGWNYFVKDEIIDKGETLYVKNS